MALGGTEWLIILVVIVLIFGGAKKIPEFAQSLGRARGEYDRGKMAVEREIAAEKNKPAAGAPQWTCAKCGAQSALEAQFCAKCGAAKPQAG